MSKKMLIDATHEEETRVAVMDDDRLVEFDYESKFRKPLKGSVFLAKVTRVEPSLQAAFVNFGGNRHGFLPFSEIHPDYFRIPISDREALLAEQQAEIEAFEKEEEEEARRMEEESKGQKGKKKGTSNKEDSEAENEEDNEADVVDAAEEVEDDEDLDDAKGNVLAEDEEDVNGNVAEDADEDEDDNRGNQKGGRRDNRRGRGGRDNRRGRGGRGRKGNRSKRTEVYDDDDAPKAFRFNLRRKYKIQEVIKRGQIMLVQVSKEERGNKGAAVTSYLSLPGRYSVLMPNSPRAGGVSRKISSYKDRSRMKEILSELEIPGGMSVIMRTAGVSRTKTEIKRDLDYLMRLWNNIREVTLESSAPALIYEEADLIKRAVRDIYSREMDEVVVSGEDGYKNAKNFMKMMIPSHAKRVVEYKDEALPLFSKYNAEVEIADIGKTQVTLPSGGYLVINPTEALVSVDVNSGKATKERHIEETALNTNMEAAVEVARQLRLRDLGGLVVVDFIDMEDRRNNGKVERKMREVLGQDRARTQMTRISIFGLMEISRQRMNPSLTESQFIQCPECSGMGRVRSADATSIMVLRAIEDEGAKGRAAEVMVHVSNAVALYILNNKRKHITELEGRFGFRIQIRVDHSVGASEYRVEVSKPIQKDQRSDQDNDDDGGDEKNRRGRRGGRGGRGRGRDQSRSDKSQSKNRSAEEESLADQLNEEPEEETVEQEEEKAKKESSSRSKGRGKGGATRGRGRKTKDSEDAEQAQEPQEEEADKPKSRAKKSSDADTVEEKTSKDKGEPQAKKAAPKKKAATKKSTSAKEQKKEEAESQGVSNDDKKPAPAKDHEKVNEPPEKKKKGWWSIGN